MSVNKHQVPKFIEAMEMISPKKLQFIFLSLSLYLLVSIRDHSIST